MRDPFLELARDVEKILEVARDFPGVSVCSFYPDVAATEQLMREGTLCFPPKCCACEAPVALWLAPAQRKGWRQRLAAGPLGACVPHCVEHGQREYARLVVHTAVTEPAIARVRLVGLSARFLDEAVALQQRGDRYPPWLAFPAQMPGSSSWRQGDGEWWIQMAWIPFWKALEPAARAAYLDRWNAPADWREWYAIDL